MKFWPGWIQMVDVPYDRETLVTVIVYHWRKDIGGCGCGWSVLGASYAEHLADVYEESVLARLDSATSETP